MTPAVPGRTVLSPQQARERARALISGRLAELADAGMSDAALDWLEDDYAMVTSENPAQQRRAAALARKWLRENGAD
jgi:hypothetical protein